MKRLFYSHPKFAKALLTAPMVIFILIGLCVVFVLPTGPDEELSVPQMFSLLGGIGLAVIYGIVVYLSPLKCVNKSVEELCRLKYGRSYFRVKEPSIRTETQRAIVARLEKHRMKPMVVETNACNGELVGVWRKRKACWFASQKSVLEDWKYRSFHYFLYSVDVLDVGTWQTIRADLTERLAKYRTEVRAEHEKTDIVNAVCVLADSVDSDVIAQVRRSQSFALTENLILRGIRVCAAAVPQNRWYLSAEKDNEESRSNRSRELLGKMTFGVSGSVFPYAGNKDYTDAYCKTLDDACNSSVAEKIQRAKAKKAEEKAALSEQNPAFLGMQEGEIKLDGDLIYCIDRGFRITTEAYLPEEAKAEMEKAEKDEDLGDIEDWLSEDEGEEEVPEEEHIPSFGSDYRGAVVVAIPTLALEPRLKFLSKSTRARLCESIRTYLLAQGFASVSFWDTDKNVIE